MSSFFDEADVHLYRWRRDNPYVSARERELFHTAFKDVRHASSLLSVGIGEGADCLFLREVVQTKKAVGIDLSAKSLRFVQEKHPEWEVACSDATHLPFANQAFACVYCKDVCHHVEDAAGMIAEMWRVLEPGGEMVIIEANGANPVIFLQGLAMSHERMVWRTSQTQLIEWVCEATGIPPESVQLRACDPLPVWRVALHYRFGLSALGGHAWVQQALDMFERAARRIVPSSRWAYLTAVVRKPHEH